MDGPRQDAELRAELAAAQAELKSCEAELAAERDVSQQELITCASLEAQLTAEKRRNTAAESEATAQQVAIHRAEAETRVQLEAAKQLRSEAFRAAQEAQHLKSESSEAAMVLRECKAALERHDADEERQSQLLSENAELEDTLKVETAIVQELRGLCNTEAKCYTVAMAECEGLRRELHDLTRMVPQPGPGAGAGYARSPTSPTPSPGRRSTAAG
ncbi:unnamed protein product [Effrenium voratum]|nr:unnamed protein product [Effrenium voratum]